MAYLLASFAAWITPTPTPPAAWNTMSQPSENILLAMAFPLAESLKLSAYWTETLIFLFSSLAAQSTPAW